MLRIPTVEPMLGNACFRLLVNDTPDDTFKKRSTSDSVCFEALPDNSVMRRDNSLN